MIDFIKNLKISYDSGYGDNLGKDFFSPCLQNCYEYKRITSDFTSNVIFDWGKALITILNRDDDKCVVKIIANPNLQQDDIEALKKTLKNKNDDEFYDEIAYKIISDAEKLVNKDLDRKEEREVKLKIFSYLISTKKLILKFGFPKHISNPNVFHIKNGIFYFSNGLKVGFNGGPNETHGGYYKNVEDIHVYKNIDGPNEYIEDMEKKFELGWNGKASGYITKPISEKTLSKIKSYAPKNISDFIKDKKKIIQNIVEETDTTLGNAIKEALSKTKQVSYIDSSSKKWAFQVEARKTFIEKKYGLLEMATGTGKTRTALSILTELFKEKKINKAIIQMKGNDLLKQWSDNINEWLKTETYADINFLKYTSEKNEFNEFLINFKNEDVDLILVSQHNLPSVLQKLNEFDLNKTIIIHDEVHDLFSEGNAEKIKGLHKKFGYRLGLSATIEDKFDIARTDLLFSEIGKIIFSYDLKEAIKNGVLVEFDLIDLSYQLTEEEKIKKKGLHASYQSRIKEGVPKHIADKDLRLKLSDVNKNAINKIQVFKDNFKIIEPHLKRSFIFADETIYVDQVFNTLIHQNINVKKHVGSASYENIEDFSNFKVDCLLNCEKLSQGIDVKSVNTIILFATPQGRQLIQRLGRVLRSDENFPNKKACVIDFYEENEMNGQEGSEYDRYQKLKDLSETKKDKNNEH